MPMTSQCSENADIDALVGQCGDKGSAAGVRCRPVEPGPVIDMQHDLTETVGREFPSRLAGDQRPVRGRGFGERPQIGFQFGFELGANQHRPGGVALGLCGRELDFRADLARGRDHVRKAQCGDFCDPHACEPAQHQ